jgi:hypothetical protein
VSHTFRVNSDTARVLVLSTPAGLERMIRDGSIPAGAPTLPPNDTTRPTPERLESIFRAHGQVNLGPPLAPAEDDIEFGKCHPTRFGDANSSHV